MIKMDAAAAVYALIFEAQFDRARAALAAMPDLHRAACAATAANMVDVARDLEQGREQPAGRRLPTPAETLQRARAALERASNALSDARDELNSDWPPGSTMTDEQADQRRRIREAITLSKTAINVSR